MKSEHGPLGCAPDKSGAALILLDLINTFDFPGGDRLLRQAVPAAQKIAGLKQRCRTHGIPAIYVNDHFGRWRSDFSALVEHCRQPEFAGRDVVEMVLPEEEDYFVFKPMYSGFYQTTLELLLHHLGSHSLIITGLASNICVLCTANDAHMRGYDLWLPGDAMAASTQEEQVYAELHFQKVLSAQITASEHIPVQRMARPKSSSE